MKQKENLVCKKKVKTKNEYRFQETNLDIFSLHDEDGKSLSDYILELQQSVKDLQINLMAEKKRRIDLVKALKGGEK